MSTDRYYVIPGVTLSTEPVNVSGLVPVKVLGQKTAIQIFKAKSGDIVFGEQQGVFFAVSGTKVARFQNRIEAEKWLVKVESVKRSTTAYCDGSFDPVTKRIGAGLVLVTGNSVTKDNQRVEKSWQLPYSDLGIVSGELSAALEAAKTAYAEGCEEVEICYDYSGVSDYMDYSGNKKEIKDYSKEMNDLAKRIKISFRKIISHSGDTLNDRADFLAKSAIRN